MGPPHAGLGLSATVGGESAFKREGELLRARQPMGKGRTAGDSPTRPPSIIHQGLFVQVICKGFHQTKSRHSENPGEGESTPQHCGIDYKMHHILWTHLYNDDTGKGRKYNIYSRFRLFFFFNFSSFCVCADSWRFTGFSFCGDPINGELRVQDPKKDQFYANKWRQRLQVTRSGSTTILLLHLSFV